MPTTREASTPSRSAIRKAESTKTPVVNHLQLQFKCTALTDFRQPGPGWSYLLFRVRLSCLMLMRTTLLCTPLLLLILPCPQLPAQVCSPSQAQAPIMRPDPKRAQQATERGDKSEAAGRFEEALAAYEEAARYAPQDAYIVEREIGRAHV